MDCAVAHSLQTVAPFCALGHRQRVAAGCCTWGIRFGLFGHDLVGLRWIENLHRNGFTLCPTDQRRVGDFL